MKYNVRFSCGHTETKELFGKVSERERRIAWWEQSGICTNCYLEQKAIENAIGHHEVEMFYGDYKRDFAKCKTKPGSYNGTTKTIIVYVPDEAPAY